MDLPVPPKVPKRRSKGLALVHYTMDYRNLAEKLCNPDIPLREWEFPCATEGAAKKMKQMLYGHWKALREEGTPEERAMARILSMSYTIKQVGLFVRLYPKFDRGDAVALRAGMAQMDAFVEAERAAGPPEDEASLPGTPDLPQPYDPHIERAEPCAGTPAASTPPGMPPGPGPRPAPALTARAIYGDEAAPSAPQEPTTPDPFVVAREAQQMVRRLGGSEAAARAEYLRTLAALGVSPSADER